MVDLDTSYCTVCLHRLQKHMLIRHWKSSVESTSRHCNMHPVDLTVGDVTVTLLVNNEKVYDVVMNTL